MLRRTNKSPIRTDPKGKFSISFRPQARTTFSLESTRRIGQLSFGQFLASSSLSSEIITAGAVALEPARSWRYAAIYDRRFGDVGVMRFELSREDVDNPVRQIALSETLIVAQNTSARTIDQARTTIEYPFERFGREDLVLRVQARFRQSDTIDPITGEARDVSGVQTRGWSLELRRDPGDGKLAWNLRMAGQTDGDDYSVRRIGESNSSGDWRASVTWEPIEGLKIGTNLNGPRTFTDSSTIFGTVRMPGLDPSAFSSTTSRRDRYGSISVEWRRRHVVVI